MAREFPGSVAYTVSADRFKGPTRLIERVVTVGVGPTEILQNNPRRVFWSLMNRSVNNGAIGFTTQVTFATGFYLTAGGGNVSMAVEEDGESVGYAVYGIQDVLAGNWYVIEVEGV